MDLMPRIIRIVVSPRDEWTRIAAERSHGALERLRARENVHHLKGLDLGGAARR
jgi:hypothetical protein